MVVQQNNNSADTTNNAENQEELNNTENEATAEVNPQETIAELQNQLALSTEKHLRALAEVENIKKRSEQAIVAANKFALTDFAKELLPVLDIFAKAINSINLENADENTKAVMQGVELTNTELQKALAKFGVVKVQAQGQMFDSNVHEALSIIEDPNLENNAIHTVIEDGYTINGRLLRAAKVIIVKNN